MLNSGRLPTLSKVKAPRNASHCQSLKVRGARAGWGWYLVGRFNPNPRLRPHHPLQGCIGVEEYTAGGKASDTGYAAALFGQFWHSVSDNALDDVCREIHDRACVVP